MDVIARTAFGLDMGTQENTDHPFIAHAATFFGTPRNKTIFTQFRLMIDVLVVSK